MEENKIQAGAAETHPGSGEGGHGSGNSGPGSGDRSVVTLTGFHGTFGG